MASHEGKKLVEIFFLPFLAQGHIIPMIDMAKLLCSRGVKSTMITTPHSANLMSKSLEVARKGGIEIGLEIIEYPSKEQCEDYDEAASSSTEKFVRFFCDTHHLSRSLEQLLKLHHPDCLISDYFLPWTRSCASKFGIPRITFHGRCFFTLSCTEIMRVCKPHSSVLSDTEPFLIPNIPDKIKLVKTQLSYLERNFIKDEFMDFLDEVAEEEMKSYGIVGNSFRELESGYDDLYRDITGIKVWNIGPFSLCNLDVQDNAHRGTKSGIDERECLNWLGSKLPNSVVYVCFGSGAKFREPQLREIAMGLDASEQNFIWAVKTIMQDGDNDKWLPEGFEKRTEGRGLIIRGWAPQVLIMDHESTGGFVSHCGWNSVLEGLCAGLPMVTWPGFADQFYNEKFVSQVLRVGVEIGTKEYSLDTRENVTSDMIEKAVRRIMVGKEAEDMRSRAKTIAGMARNAVEKDGSSYRNLDALIEDLSMYKNSTNKIVE